MPRNRHARGFALTGCCLVWTALAAGCSKNPDSAETVRRFNAPEATQGVAVGDRFFYAVGNTIIAKYDKTSGQRVAEWRERAGGPITHLDSGVVIDRQLYCANSNYPQTPMISSIEVFDAERLEHLRSIPLPAMGSATWVDRGDDSWWVTFAHYSGQGGEPGKPSRDTRLVQFTSEWKPQKSWAFPDAVVSRWGEMSSSGGTLTGRGVFYTTGHDAPELYVVATPAEGTTLVLQRIVRIESEGQGIAVDRANGLLYSIQRRTGQVIVARIPAATQP